MSLSSPYPETAAVTQGCALIRSLVLYLSLGSVSPASSDDTLRSTLSESANPMEPKRSSKLEAVDPEAPNSKSPQT